MADPSIFTHFLSDEKDKRIVRFVLLAFLFFSLFFFVLLVPLMGFSIYRGGNFEVLGLKITMSSNSDANVAVTREQDTPRPIADVAGRLEGYSVWGSTDFVNQSSCVDYVKSLLVSMKFNNIEEDEYVVFGSVDLQKMNSVTYGRFVCHNINGLYFISGQLTGNNSTVPRGVGEDFVRKFNERFKSFDPKRFFGSYAKIVSYSFPFVYHGNKDNYEACLTALRKISDKYKFSFDINSDDVHGYLDQTQVSISCYSFGDAKTAVSTVSISGFDAQKAKQIANLIRKSIIE